jgi:hypothetical protein
MVKGKVTVVKMAGPEGIIPAWLVEGEDGTSTLFSGVNASERATSYARANYINISFVIQAEPGRLGLRGDSLGKEAA